MRLKGKSAIVTGSSSGIGSEIAFLFAMEGGSVIVNCNKRTDEGRDVVEKIQKAGGSADLCIADVRSPEDAERLAQHAIKRFGKIDVLVNNAWIIKDSLIENMTEEQWRDVLDTNLTGAFNCSKSVLPHMKGQGHGNIINMSSVVAEMGNIGQINYIASKAGIIGLTKALSLELSRYGIRVNAIAPGFCTTRIIESTPEKVKEKILSRIPLKRFGDPKEIAHAALFLASDECSYITGHVLSVNGGLHL